MSGAIMNKVLDLFGMDNTEEEYDEEEGYEEETEQDEEQEEGRNFWNRRSNKEKVVNMPQANQIKMVISQPTTFEQSEAICDLLKEKKSVIVNLEYVNKDIARRIVDVISDVNLCYSEFARKYLADTGLPKERTYMTGSPMAEVLHMNLEKIQKSDVLDRLGLEKDKYILLSAHREENIDSEKNFLSLFTAINALAQKYDMPILYSCHPRSKNRLEKSEFKLDPRVRVNEPLGFNDYNKLQMNALAIVSDSGTLPEESSFYLSIGHPIAAVCIRTSTERPEALEAGDFILAGITTKELLNATDMAIEMKQKGVLGKPCPDYVDETVSMKVVRIIQGYVNVVNKMVWRKDQ